MDHCRFDLAIIQATSRVASSVSLVKHTVQIDVRIDGDEAVRALSGRSTIRDSGILTGKVDALLPRDAAPSSSIWSPSLTLIAPAWVNSSAYMSVQNKKGPFFASKCPSPSVT